MHATILNTKEHCAGLEEKHEVMWASITKHSQHYLFGVIYHPPRPVYNTRIYLDRLGKDIDELTSLYPNSILYLTGDFNHLNIDNLLADTGLNQIVSQPTRGRNTLDLFLTNRPDTVTINVIQSSLKTDHLGLLTNILPHPDIKPASNRTVTFFDIRAHHLLNLQSALQSYNWTHVTTETDIDIAYQDFLDISHWHIKNSIPVRTVTLGPRTPAFITPLIKSLLRKRNKLMHKGKLPEANTLTTKIGKLISEHRSSCLSNVNPSSSKQLWQVVNGARGTQARAPLKLCNQLIDIDDLNKHFASVATDANYDHSVIDHILANPPQPDQSTQSQSSLLHLFTETEIETALSYIKKSAPGTDNLPYWFFKHCSIPIAPVIMYIFNLSLTSGKPPIHWKKALITPVPKTNNPTSFADFRPISVTPLLSRLFERHIARKIILPCIPPSDLDDQFAFRPTGSTTAALINTLHNVTSMLERNTYVRCLFIDFSKAFDTVNHSILFAKLQTLSLPPNIFTWIVNFLTDRLQAVSSNGIQSDFRPISQSIVQGSGLGPVLFIIYISSLRSISKLNHTSKYADDVTIISPQNSDVDITSEFEHVLEWATAHKLTVNLSKTKELVFHKPNPRSLSLPPPIPGIEQVKSFKLLGVHLTSHLSMDCHVNFILSIINQRFYLLNQLKKQGLATSSLNVIFHALILSRIDYALPSFAGFLSEHNKSRLNATLRKGLRWCITDLKLTVQDLIDISDRALFDVIKSPSHCLHSLLPPPSPALSQYDLRPRGHSLSLPSIKTTTFMNSFINRTIFQLK